MSKQKNVLSTYDQRAKTFMKKDPSDRWDYMLSKSLCDHYLLSKINIKNKKILNIGCSRGADELVFVPQVKQWVAIDINKNVIKSVKNLVKTRVSPSVFRKMKFKVDDAANLSFKDKEFDISLSFSTFDHILDKEKREKAFYEIARVTKKGGYVIVTGPNKWNLPYYLWSKKAQGSKTAYFGHSYSYEHDFTPWEMKRLLKRAGLKPLEFASNFVFTPSIWFGGLKNMKPRSCFLKYFGFRMGYLCKRV